MRYFVIIILLCWANPCLLPAQDVYKTPSGNKYHLAECRNVKNVSEKITVAKAIAAGLTACKICKPAYATAPANKTVKKAQGIDKGVQCKGKTKAGKRCKHYTKIGNGYCFQHQKTE